MTQCSWTAETSNTHSSATEGTTHSLKSIPCASIQSSTKCIHPHRYIGGLGNPSAGACSFPERRACPQPTWWHIHPPPPSSPHTRSCPHLWLRQHLPYEKWPLLSRLVVAGLLCPSLADFLMWLTNKTIVVPVVLKWCGGCSRNGLAIFSLCECACAHMEKAAFQLNAT